MKTAVRGQKALTTGLELVLCACEGDLHLVLTDDEELVFSATWGLRDRAPELLAPTLDVAFRQAGFSFQDLRRIGCVRGPGSFTGIRLVLATAAALRRATRARLAALDYMQALATTLAMGEHLLYGRKIVVLTHARRDLVHCAAFTSYGPVIPCVPHGEITLVSPGIALQDIRNLALAESAPVLVLGSALARQKELCALLEAEKNVGVRAQRTPSVDALRLLGRHGDYFDRDVEPLYIRPCDAVENLPELSRRMGQDPDRAGQELERLLGREVQDEAGAQETEIPGPGTA